MSIIGELFDCRRAVTLGSELIDGSIHGPARWTLALHVRFCWNCRPHVEQLRTTVDVLHALPKQPTTVSPDAKQRILDRIKERKPATPDDKQER